MFEGILNHKIRTKDEFRQFTTEFWLAWERNYGEMPLKFSIFFEKKWRSKNAGSNTGFLAAVLYHFYNRHLGNDYNSDILAVEGVTATSFDITPEMATEILDQYFGVFEISDDHPNLKLLSDVKESKESATFVYYTNVCPEPEDKTKAERLLFVTKGYH